MLPFANYYISTPIMSEKKKNITRTIENRRKTRWSPTLFTGGGKEDELATVKAAAWAWYQRHEGKPMMKEFDITTRAKRTPIPSRYKLEANKNMILSKNMVSKSRSNHLLPGDQETIKFSSLLDPYENKILSENRVSKPHVNHLSRGDEETNKFSSLLDPYEIKSISKRIDEGSLSTSVFKNDLVRHYDHNMLRNKLEDDSKKENGMVRIRNLWKGMGLIMASRRVCGRSDDVDLSVYRPGPNREKIARNTRLNTRTNGR